MHFLYKCITGIYARDAEIEILYLGFMTKFEFDKKAGRIKNIRTCIIKKHAEIPIKSIWILDDGWILTAWYNIIKNELDPSKRLLHVWAE